MTHTRTDTHTNTHTLFLTHTRAHTLIGNELGAQDAARTPPRTQNPPTLSHRLAAQVCVRA